ncbi:hypothetical protein KORDIASMS9_01223 [Kordia sp. SMS9]|uniref:DUF5687 family protein n=1 Tax=Kordia sp. SMS9 TaxID=2282170 RepID=UPI000E0D68DB|nr:DUF5687 family protein [Kordia sp. SMS9]AXG69004.1 hypothetical protein KORDIASMS9_01223 [Kordia sp. SMS9]
MIQKFISLQWKEFLRSASFQKGVAIKVLLFIAAAYVGGMAIVTGAGLYLGIKKMIPGVDPMLIVNSFIIFWFMADLLLRYFMQQMPVMNIKPLMIIPIKQKNIIHFLLGKSVISFFNLLPLLVAIPYCITALINGNHSPLNVILWLLSIIIITLSINFLNMLVNKSNTVFYIVATVLVSSIACQYFGVFNIAQYGGMVFYGLYMNPFYIVVPIAILALLYYANFNYLNNRFYLDSAISKKVKEVNASDLSWLDRFGSMATFLKNDVRMIWRNKRPRQVVIMSFLFLFYGVIFFTQKVYNDMPAMLAFASIFITAGFLFSFGQLVPSWDSEHYKMMMSQNIPYRQYLESKWYLMVLAVLVSFILSTPYIYFGWDKYALIAAGASFNIGINTFVTLFGGALNRVPIKLNEKAKAFSNTNGFNPTQLLIALPKLLLPVGLFWLPYYLADYNLNAGIITLAVSGLLGLVFKDFFLTKIEKVYQDGKYKTIAAFDEK